MTARRDFLKLSAGAALGSAALPPAIARALELPGNRKTGSIKDVEHVVIFMQENRSFDHYFGTMRGVRGYGDPRAITLPGGDPVWLQPSKTGPVGPFHLDSRITSAQTIRSLDHSWKHSHDRWKHHDAWIQYKTPMTMGYFTRADIPFYYALADAFTVCDGYHCSIFGPTNPNRLFLFTGTSGLGAGDSSVNVVANPALEFNNYADPARDSAKFKALTWTTYAERLQAAGVSWKVYQEYDNYGDNGLAYFANFRGIGPDHELYKRGRAWSAGSDFANARTSQGEHLVAQFAADVAADTLPQVSWIIASESLSEHPDGSPAAGEYLTARLISALAANPEVWAKTAFILNYDENDGFFDHVPPYLPAAGTAPGKTTVDGAGEVYNGETVGLGPRVPLVVVSPWTKGGYVNSQVLDHTSVIRFVETRFGVAEPNITPWRRAVCGDLTTVFDFAGSGRGVMRRLPDAAGLPALATQAKLFPKPVPVADVKAPPRQEPGQRPARALPYAFDVSGQSTPDGLTLTIANTGAAGAAFNLYAADGDPRFYTVEAGKTLRDAGAYPQPWTEDRQYSLHLHGPNGFLRSFAGQAHTNGAEAHARFDPASGKLLIILSNEGSTPVTLKVVSNAYGHGARRHKLAPGAQVVDAWNIRKSGHWYDFTVTSEDDHAFERRIAGHGEDGRPSVSDPLLGRQTA